MGSGFQASGIRGLGCKGSQRFVCLVSWLGCTLHGERSRAFRMKKLWFRPQATHVYLQRCLRNPLKPKTPKTLIPKTQNPKTLIPKTQNPKTLNPQNPETSGGHGQVCLPRCRPSPCEVWRKGPNSPDVFLRRPGLGLGCSLEFRV